MSRDFAQEEELARIVGQLLQAKGFSLAVAESCTGGLLASLITDIPGSSDYFLGGVTAYANAIKERILGVEHEVLATHGAVSREVALAMAAGVRKLMGVDLALATTGIAGPGGGTTQKPVGLTYIALAGEGFAICRSFIWQGDRWANKLASAGAALDMLGEYLRKERS